MTFATHDQPTFNGWVSGHDLAVKRGHNLDPGESDTRFLADTPSRLLMVSLEDALGDIEQVNLPGTVDEHPNWRRRLSVPLEDLLESSALSAVAKIMETSGRKSKTPRR